MNLLLDTHIALWAITDSPRLSSEARKLIASEQTTVFVSVASLWEISIKHSLGRGDMPIGAQEAMGYFRASGYRLLAIAPEHVIAVADLAPHHYDPFDRMIVAQALVEPLRLVTHDAKVQLYSSTIIGV